VVPTKMKRRRRRRRRKRKRKRRDGEGLDEGGEEGSWDVALRGDRMRVGTSAFVNEGTAPGVRGRYAAARLKEAQAAEVTISRELPVISKENTSAYSIALKEKTKEEAKALMVVEDDSVLVGLIDKYADAVLFDEGDGKTYVVLAVQYDERKGSKYYEATCVWDEQEESWSWAVPSSSFVTGSEVAKDKPMLGCAVMDLTATGAPVLLSDVDDVISARSARETAVLEGEDRSNKEKEWRKAPRKGFRKI
jgi:hypothetical protein